jgi:hypothetical protein
MSFAESLKETVRRKAHLRCCVCRSFGVEIHHIVPEAEGGPDVLENAAPLCPSCHETYGANTTKRKLIREVRDLWYELCEKQEPLVPQAALQEIAASLKNVATKEDLARISINPGTIGGRPPGTDRYSFVRQEFIHPLIVRELVGWISDKSETIVSVDLLSANRSNRFHGDFSTKEENGRVLVTWTGEAEAFGYADLATSPSGIHMVQRSDWTVGSGIFMSICLLTLEGDRSFYENAEGTSFSRDRVVLKTLGSISLGDR